MNSVRMSVCGVGFEPGEGTDHAPEQRAANAIGSSSA